MKCPICGGAELVHDTRDLPYTYKGETTHIPAVTGDFCPACAESILDAAESDRVMRETRAEHIYLSDNELVRKLAGMRHNWIYEYTPTLNC